MSKLLVAIGLVGALVIANPAAVFDHLGPEAQVVGSKLKRAIDVGGYFRVRGSGFQQ
jgi:hypothetical protein